MVQQQAAAAARGLHGMQNFLQYCRSIVNCKMRGSLSTKKLCRIKKATLRQPGGYAGYGRSRERAALHVGSSPLRVIPRRTCWLYSTPGRSRGLFRARLAVASRSAVGLGTYMTGSTSISDSAAVCRVHPGSRAVAMGGRRTAQHYS